MLDSNSKAETNLELEELNISLVKKEGFISN